MDALLDRWVDDPISNINILNQLVPLLMKTFTESGTQKGPLKEVISTVESIREILDERNILKPSNYALILDPSKAKAV